MYVYQTSTIIIDKIKGLEMYHEVKNKEENYVYIVIEKKQKVIGNYLQRRIVTN